MSRSVFHYQSKAADQGPLVGRIKELAATRECLAIEVAAGLRGVDVVRVTDAVTMLRGAPQSIRVDNGPEFISRVLDWQTPAEFARRCGVEPAAPSKRAPEISTIDRS